MASTGTKRSPHRLSAVFRRPSVASLRVKRSTSTNITKSDARDPQFHPSTTVFSSDIPPTPSTTSFLYAASNPCSSLPSTTNFLDNGQKARMVKKARKLSSVFGDIAVLDTLLPKFNDTQFTSSQTHERSSQDTLAAAVSQSHSEEHGNPTATGENAMSSCLGDAGVLLGTPSLPKKILTTPRMPSHGLRVRRTNSCEKLIVTCHRVDDNQGLRRSRSLGVHASQDLVNRNSLQNEWEAISHGRRYQLSKHPRKTTSPSPSWGLEGSVESLKDLVESFSDGNLSVTASIFTSEDATGIQEDNISTASVFSYPSQSEAAISEDLLNKSNFQQRRRRAAKLAQFFGVNPLDITSSVTLTTKHQKQPSLTEYLSNSTNIPSNIVEVGVQVSNRRIWEHRGRLKSTDMHDAIEQLRNLRA